MRHSCKLLLAWALAYSGEVIDKLDHLISGLRILIHFSGDRVILFTEPREREGGRERGGGERERINLLVHLVRVSPAISTD